MRVMPKNVFNSSATSLKRIAPIIIAFAALVGVALAGEMLTGNSEAPVVSDTNKVVQFETGGTIEENPDSSAAESSTPTSGDREKSGENSAGTPGFSSSGGSSGPSSTGGSGAAGSPGTQNSAPGSGVGSGPQSVPAPQLQVTDLGDDDWDDDGDDWDDGGDD